MIGIIGFNDLHLMQFLYKYTNILNEENIPYEIVYWNRSGLPLDPQFRGKAHGFSYAMNTYQPFIKKIKGFIQYSLYMKRIIRRQKYDKLVVLTTQTAIPLFFLLTHRYRNRFVYDYRDITKEKKVPFYQRAVKKMIACSAFSAFSSPGFLPVLNIVPSEKTVISHNIQKEWQSTLQPIKKKENLPIRLVYWGMVRQPDFNRRVCDLFGGDSRFELVFHGDGIWRELQTYCAEHKYNNIFFTGHYVPADIPDFAKETDILNCLYENTDATQPTLAVKLYDAVQYRLPTVISAGSYLAEYVKDTNGFFPSSLSESMPDELFDRYRSLQIEQAERDFSRLTDSVFSEDRIFRKKLVSFVANECPSSQKTEIQSKSKIVFVDVSCEGHHSAYIKKLVSGYAGEAVAVLPTRIEDLPCRQLLYSPVDLVHKNLFSYIRWAREVAGLVKKEKADIVHILNADVYYKYFGLGIGFFGRSKVLLTLHWVRPGFLQKTSCRFFCGMADSVVVHSAYLKQNLEAMGVTNAVHIEYPYFDLPAVDREEAYRYFGLQKDIRTLACIGSTREDKGLDILLGALKKVDKPFQLLIAGAPETFDKAYIEEKTEPYKDRVSLCLHYLTDKELALAYAVSDMIVLPYRSSFNGASGPLTEGVWFNRCIIGSCHGNLGKTITDNHLGYTFETENETDLARILSLALAEDFSPDLSYTNYRQTLSSDYFAQAYYSLYRSLLSI